MLNIIPNKGFVEQKLFTFSNRLGYKLPEDYINFLRLYNGGYLKNSISTYYKNGKQKFILTSLYGLEQGDDLLYNYEVYKNRIPKTCVPIGEDAGGNLVCLNLSEDKCEYVYFWDHEEELNYENGKITISDLYIIAKSFKGFLNSIEQDSINDIEEGEHKVKKVWVDQEFLNELKNNQDE